MHIFNNTTDKVGDDLKQTITQWSKIRLAAAIFSMYWFTALHKELSSIDTLHFLFTEPLFVSTDMPPKQQKFFELQSHQRQKSLSWSSLEINLKNKLTGKAIAKECRQRIEKKVRFKSSLSHGRVQPLLTISNKGQDTLYTGINEFSTAWLGYEKDNALLGHIIKTDEYHMTQQVIKQFDDLWNDKTVLKDVTDEVIAYISTLYQENAPEYIYYVILYNIFDEFLEDISDDELANEKTWFKESKIWSLLYDFQKDAVLWLINKLERHNGCILADSVWLWKTFSALWVIKYYQSRNKNILVLCPKKLGDNWLTFKSNYEDNPVSEDRFDYDVLYHTDLSREYGESNGLDLSRINRWNYDLVVIDESHNFRNNNPRKDKVTRYQKLLNDVMRKWVKTKVLMLSATPVNNRFTDLKNQIALAYEWHTDHVDHKLDTSSSINTILAQAQKTFNERSELPPEERTWSTLLQKLTSQFDFFRLLDSVTIARSRKHIEKYYDMASIGRFPLRRKPHTQRSHLTDLTDVMDIHTLYEQLQKLSMSIYTPFDYILEGKKTFYDETYDTKTGNNSSLKQTTREHSLQKLMRVNLLKRLESSVDSFRITLQKFIDKNKRTIGRISDFEHQANMWSASDLFLETTDTDDSEWLDDEFAIGDKIKINLIDMNTLWWKKDLEQDLQIAQHILHDMTAITPTHDAKLADLKTMIADKQRHPINPGNKKVLIFSAFADTANYLYDQLKDYNKTLWLETWLVVGWTGNNQTTLPINKQFNNILIHFSPRSKKSQHHHNGEKEIDILIATDCISEWQNLQDCDMLINYDIHRNPVRIIQRFGRIDRIWSTNKEIQLINFRPQLSLDEYINLKNRVENRMFMVDATATGEDNVLTNESSDLVFRKQQLQKLQEEVVDIEDMDSWISIMDLWLNEFRMDLINYIKHHDQLDTVPFGMHTVCRQDSSKWIVPWVIYVLKNIHNAININNTNQLHPFYLVYITHTGEIASHHLNVKHTLDLIRSMCKGNTEALADVCEIFNHETDDGKQMDHYSDLLNQAIQSIIHVSDESDIDSLFGGNVSESPTTTISWLQDFELISFIVIT